MFGIFEESRLCARAAAAPAAPAAAAQTTSPTSTTEGPTATLPLLPLYYHLLYHYLHSNGCYKHHYR